MARTRPRPKRYLRKLQARKPCVHGKPGVELAPYQVILKPLVTEKGTHQSTRYNSYTFEVSPIATKTQIWKAVEDLFHVLWLWFDLTTLLIPGHNDDPADIDRMTRWVVEHLGRDVPMHFTAFHPDYKMRDVPPTPAATLTMARDIDGQLKTFNDIYGRDAPVLASFNAPRVGNRARVTSEEVIEIVDDLQTS